MQIINQNIERIQDFCQSHKVLNLYVFGSVVKNQLAKDSDIDFLVDFCINDISDYADNYFSLKESLENTLHRKIDLLENQAIKNPFLRRSIDQSKRLIYGRPNQNMAL